MEAARETEDGDGGQPDMSGVAQPHEPTPPFYSAPAYSAPAYGMPNSRQLLSAPAATETTEADHDRSSDSETNGPVIGFPMTNFAMNAPGVAPESSVVAIDDEDRGDLVADAPETPALAKTAVRPDAVGTPAPDSSAQAGLSLMMRR